MEEALIARLLASAAVIAEAGTRINWVDRPQYEEIPDDQSALTLQLIDGGIEYHHSGSTDLQYHTIQFDCWSHTYLAAKRLARAVRAEMEAAATLEGIQFEEGFVTRQHDRDADKLEDGSEVFGVRLDILVPHKAALAVP